MDLRRKQWLAFAALGVVWGSTWIVADTLTGYVPPLLGAAARFLLAALLCIPVMLWKRIKLPRGRALGFVLVLSFTMVVLPLLLLFGVRQHVQSATVAVLFAAMPLLVVFLTPVLEGRVVPRSAMYATIVGMGTIALAVGASFSAAQLWGAVVVLLAVASIGASSLLAHRELRYVHPVAVTALLLGAAAPILFIAGMTLERGQAVQWNGSAIGSTVFLALVAGAAGYATYFWLLQQLHAYQAATLQWVEPLVALGQSAFFLRQGWSFSMIAESLVTLAALWAVMVARPEDDDTVSLLGN